MKRETIDLAEERQIVTNMILSTEYLCGLFQLIKLYLFKSAYAKIVVSWILEFYEHYREAPGKHIQDIYLQKAHLIHDEDETEMVAEFLSRLADESDGIQNIEYSLNSAIKYLKIQSIRGLTDKLNSALLEGDPLKCEQLIANYSRIERASGEGVSILDDTVEVQEAFCQDDEILFRFKGALGHILGLFLRGDLVAFMGAMGRGKTWWLWEIGKEAMFNGLKVVHFTLEMPRKQMIRRAWQGLIGAVRESAEINFPFFEKAGLKWVVSFKKLDKDQVNPGQIASKQKKLKSLLRSASHKTIAIPAHSSTVVDIEAHLDNMYYYDHFMPDVVVIDYADLLAPSNHRIDYRHQLDDIWKSLRRMSYNRNILVVTATQSNRKGLSQDADEGDVAEDVRKLAHVSKMMVLNQKPDEYERGIMRVQLLKERDGKKSFNQAIVLQCLDIGRPHIDSRFKSEVNLEVE